MSFYSVSALRFTVALMGGLAFCAGSTRAEDCNNNGIEDATDIADGTSEDCQPDGVPDDCQLGAPFSNDSGNLSPIHGGSPQSHTISSPPRASSQVALNFEIRADLDFPGFIQVRLNGTFIGQLFGTFCSSVPDSAMFVLSAETYNGIVGGGDAVIGMVASGAQNVCNPISFVRVTTSYQDSANDCNLNTVPDECDISGGSSTDDNENGIPDECETFSVPGIGDDTCQSPTADTGIPCSSDFDCFAGTVCGTKSRYITIIPDNLAPEVGVTTIQVEIIEMKQCAGGTNNGRGCTSNAHCPGSTCIDSPNIGDIWWAGPEQSLPNAPAPTLRGARLQCTPIPHAQTWTWGNLHLFGTVTIPGSLYDVRMCDANGTNCSPPLTVGTCKWGDIVRPFYGNSQPNFDDIAASVNKFSNLNSSPPITRTDLTGTGQPGNPNTPNQTTNLADISACVEAFRGMPYPYTVPACP